MIICHTIAVFQTGTQPEQKIVADDLGLLFDAVMRETLARQQFIIIAAEGMARQRQEDALLMLPDMHHFVNEQCLDILRRFAKIIAEQVALGMEPEIAVGGHCNPPVLEQPPFAVEDGHLTIVDGLPENRDAQRNFSRGQCTTTHEIVRSFNSGCCLAGLFDHRINLDAVII